MDCVSYVKWICNIEYPDRPKNIFTNENLSISDEYRIYNFTKSYYNTNIFYKNYYIQEDEDLKLEKKELMFNLNDYYRNILDRNNPNRILNRTKLMINDNKMILNNLLISIGYNFSIRNIGVYSKFNQNENLKKF